MATTFVNASRRTKRILAGTGALTLVGGGIAFAYWTTTGSGTGSASTGSNQAITVVQTSTVTAMAPGIAPQALSGTFTNPNPGPVFVNEVAVSISSITQDPASVALGNCEVDDYTIVGSPITIGTEVLANDTSTWSGATIAFANAAAENQDGCKNATVNLAYTSN